MTSTCDSNTWHGEEHKISAGNLSLNWPNLPLQLLLSFTYLGVLSMNNDMNIIYNYEFIKDNVFLVKDILRCCMQCLIDQENDKNCTPIFKRNDT